MLWRRHHAQAQVAGKAESRQEADETNRIGRGAPTSVPGHFAGARMTQFMQVFTALVLAAFAAYAGAWYIGSIESNFALLVSLATATPGAFWLAEQCYFLPCRRRAAQALPDVTQTLQGVTQALPGSTQALPGAQHSAG